MGFLLFVCFSLTTDHWRPTTDLKIFFRGMKGKSNLSIELVKQLLPYIFFVSLTIQAAAADNSAQRFAAFWTKWAPEHYVQALSKNFWLSPPDSGSWIYQIQFHWDGTPGNVWRGGWLILVLKKGNFTETEKIKDCWRKDSLSEWMGAPALYECFYPQGIDQPLTHWAAFTIYLPEIDASFKIVIEGVHTPKEMEGIMSDLPLEGMVKEVFF